MRLSAYFLPLLKESPADAQIVSHQLMLRAGMVRQLSAGIYSWLPLGHAVLRRVEQIVREEMERAGCQEILMPSVQPAELWQESGRYEAYGKEMLRFLDRHERPMLLGPTHEEVVTDIFRRCIRSYRDLPQNLYQIQWKFRDEIRPRFGVMRGREFLMKDNYSFDLDFEGAKRSYDNMFQAYLRTFKRMGLTAIPMRADSGAIGGDMSHEFQILAPTGESEVFFDAAFEEIDFFADDLDIERLKELYAATDEQHDPSACPVPAERLRHGRGIEVGHIFYFGTKYSKALGATVTGPDGDDVIVEMGSYGIGVSRLVGALIEANHDDKGIIWPESVAPFRVGLINLRASDETCTAMTSDLDAKLRRAGVSTLYDDRNESPGVKFATMELIGLPYQVIVGPRGVKAGVVEVKDRRTGETVEMSPDAMLDRFAR
ncbi:MAG: proline--tRNA ligase [Geminicoccaceae bacterium]|nr:MAG: proline--tRNA ligase [Geminicoccaceae bacterium]